VLASGVVVWVSIETSLNHSLWLGAGAYALLAGVAPKLLKLGQASQDEYHTDVPPIQEGEATTLSDRG
jgi:hypothetical protein